MRKQEGALNILNNRKERKYSPKIIFLRILWGLARPLFCFSPRPFFSWRCFLLRLFGAKIGKHVHIYNSATIYMPWNLEIDDWSAIGELAYIYNLGKVTIGKKSTISHKAHICAGTHDFQEASLPLLKPPITIGDQVWICADAFIGPGVEIHEGVVVGARSCVFKSVEPWTVVGGNPAIPIKKRVMKG